jgi:hypothetical protein
MSDGRNPKFKEPMQDIYLPKMKLEVESEAKPETPLTAEQIYLKRQAEVAQQDNEDFSDYLREKASRDQQQAPQPTPMPPPAAAPQTAPRRLNRRSLLTWAAGTAVVGEAVTFGYPMLTGQTSRITGRDTPPQPIPNPSAIPSIANWSIRRRMWAGGASATGCF